MSESTVHLSITPLKISEIPAEDAIIQAGRELIDSTATWKQGKTYQKNTVKTFSRPKGSKDGAGWHLRVSEHTKEDATFDEFWSKLGLNKAENEMQYIPDIKKVKLIKRISPTQSVWTLYYHFAPPVSPRVFTVVQTTWLSDTTPRTGMIVSIPVDVTEDAEYAKLEEKGVKGRYVSVERIQELDNGKVEWHMATSSTPGGSIPQFVAESSMASTISHDVTHFLGWLHKNRSAEPAAPSETADVHAAAPQEELAPSDAVAEASGPGAVGATA
ncbi:hypothetical protein OH76DRAFT_1451588 [Lentinus brumalis]|uniref:DUF3074 domain-containing protein n=1 Tax=Lentinus brumalis TaxID=2498619 RepID=A0A371DVD1_9APHY|nr:hypothetical protein OH76DRAFT_1451588 [Polyporus brumalis]